MTGCYGNRSIIINPQFSCHHSNEAEVVSSATDLYDVGTFVQITELQEFGERARMIIQGHRR